MNYNLVIIVKPSEDPGKIEAKFNAILEKEGFQVQKFELWGKQQLTYPIQKFSEGIYFSMIIHSDSAKPQVINTRFKLDDTILRSLILKEETKN